MKRLKAGWGRFIASYTDAKRTVAVAHGNVMFLDESDWTEVEVAQRTIARYHLVFVLFAVWVVYAIRVGFFIWHR